MPDVWTHFCVECKERFRTRVWGTLLCPACTKAAPSNPPAGDEG